jgi:photosystem II stability/assembly factor-like uncharacterized protein
VLNGQSQTRPVLNKLESQNLSGVILDPDRESSYVKIPAFAGMTIQGFRVSVKHLLTTATIPNILKLKSKWGNFGNIMKKKTFHISSVTNNSRFLVASMAVSSALILSRPVLPAIAYAVEANKYSWTKQEIGYTGGETLNSAAISASGSHQIVSSVESAFSPPNEQHPLYVSTNYGTSWQNVAQTADPAVSNMWSSVDISNDGQVMVAVSRAGFELDGGEEIPAKVVLSHNAGASWTNITPDGLQGGENKVVVSGDGSTVAVTGGFNLYISDDEGASWETPVIDADNGLNDNYLEIWSVSMSDDADKLLVSNMGSGAEFEDFYLSEDGGANWAGIDTLPETNLVYPTIAVSADGNTIAVAGITFEGGENDYVFTSTTDGAIWTDVTPEDDAFNLWSSIDMSDDGKTFALLGVEYLGGEHYSMYSSQDAGAHWTKEQADENTDNEIGSLYTDFILGDISFDLSSDGSRAIVARSGGVYTGVIKSTSASLTDAEGGKPITITTPSGTTITCSSALKESAQVAQDGAYDYPLGLVNFCFDTNAQENQVSLTFVTDLKPNEAVARKYNPTTQTYFDIPGAVITETTLEGQHALMVTYTITDNGQLDLDPTSGKIIDPVGLATLSNQLANTGDNANLLAVIAFITTIGSAVVLQRRRYSRN